MNKFLTAAITKSPTNGTGEFEAVVYDPAAGDVDGVVITVQAMKAAAATFVLRDRDLVLRWNHDRTDPDSALGVITDVKVSDGKLLIRGRLDLSNEKSVRVHEGMLTGRINEFSIAWTSPPDGFYESNGVVYITDMELTEISVVPAGANRGTRLVSVKSFPASAELARYARLIDEAAKIGPTVGQKVLERERQLLAERMAAERAAAVRAKEAREDIDRRSLALTFGPSRRVQVDPRTMRVIRSDDDDREAVRRENELAAIQAREAERAEEAAAATRAAEFLARTGYEGTVYRQERW